MWMLLSMCALALADEPVVVSQDGLAQVAVGATLYAADSGVTVRAAPGQDSAVVARLELGAAVQRRAGAASVVSREGQPGAWLPAQVGETEGYVWTGDLTPARFSVDLDADGEVEVVTVAWDASGKAVVRAREPAVQGGAAVSTVALGPFEDINGLQTTARASVRDAAETGVPLLHLLVLAGDYCGSSDHHVYTSLSTPGAGQPSVLAEALRHFGDGGDAPVWSSATLVFDAANKTATLTQESGEDTVTTHRSTTDYVLQQGVFVKTRHTSKDLTQAD